MLAVFACRRVADALSLVRHKIKQKKFADRVICRYLNCPENIPRVYLGVKGDTGNHLGRQSLDLSVLREAVASEQEVNLTTIVVLILLDDG